MNMTGPIIGGFGGLALALGIGTIADVVAPRQEPFMTVNRIEQDGVNIVFERIVQNDVRAEWSVRLYGEGKHPVCEGGAHADYTASEPQTQPMHIDDFIGEENCLLKLMNGIEYLVVVVWLARDAGPPIVERFTFTAPRG